MKNTARSRWNNLQLHRSIYLQRAIDCSALTIPTLIPQSDLNWGWTGEDYNNIKSLYQGAGAQGVSGLSAKLLLALYPPAQPFFRLTIDKAKLEEYMEQTQADPEELQSQLDIALSSMERQMLLKLDELKARSALFEAIKHLIVGGNALLYAGAEGVRMYSLRSYVVDRDPEGNISEIVIREQVARRTLAAWYGRQRRWQQRRRCQLASLMTCIPTSRSMLITTGLIGIRNMTTRRSQRPQALVD
jgi:hypothetical protein